jgi:hypothetical protein
VRACAQEYFDTICDNVRADAEQLAGIYDGFRLQLLKRYTEIWYSQLFAVAPAADQLSLGDILLRTEREFLFRYGLSSEHKAFLSQQVLLGDPALRILHPILR